MPRLGLLVLAIVIAGACARREAAAPAPVAPAEVVDAGPLARRLARALPAAAPPFAGGPLLIADGFVRRRYQQGAATVEITVAWAPSQGDDYERWVEASRAYPQAELPLPPAAANGFFSCTDATPGSPCDLHIQLSAGYHVEVMGGGHATRADLERLMSRIPLAALAGP
jgi:hypothetical protein